ncbi:SDR family oxidoreductase [Pilimelia columellifera]|uniref:SDR family oxidoreductase n=1 Tax=Pilimelia columellifera subsp. columellifera TaxID=706583 RepID=A0ABN3NPS0_9ACTN
MRTALITGATSGIGMAIAHALSRRGDRLIVCGRDDERLGQLIKRLPGARALIADLSAPATLQDTLAGALPERLDVLVHSAGVALLGPLADAGPAAWQQTLTVNLAGPAELTRLCLPALRSARGHVVMINSGAGKQANAGWGSYAASKFGLRALADVLRAEEAPNGVKVTSVYPGRTASAMQESVHAQEGRTYHPARWIQPDSVALAVAAALDLPADAELTELVVRPRPL